MIRNSLCAKLSLNIFVQKLLFTRIYDCENREIRAGLQLDVLAAQSKLPGSAPGLAIVQVGGRVDSNVYIRMKIRAAAEIGIIAEHIQLPNTATEHELLKKVCANNI